MVERAAVNRDVAGSSPASGANLLVGAVMTVKTDSSRETKYEWVPQLFKGYVYSVGAMLVLIGISAAFHCVV